MEELNTNLLQQDSPFSPNPDWLSPAVDPLLGIPLTHPSPQLQSDNIAQQELQPLPLGTT